MAMFWRFAPLLSQIGTLLDKEDVQLSDVIEEDDIIQECRSHNSKLIELIIKPENLTTLVHYIIEDPSDDVPQETQYKLSNISSELLSSDVNDVNDAIVDGESYLDMLYDFFQKEEPLNPLLASFVTKVWTVLMQRKGEKIVQYTKEKKDFLDRLLRHIDTSAVMDLLLKFIHCTEPTVARTAMVEWLNEEKLVSKLIDLMNPEENDEKHVNVCQCLANFVAACREQVSHTQECPQVTVLLDSLESSETITQLLNHMLSSAANDSVIVNGLFYIQALLDKKKSESPLDALVLPTQFELERLQMAAMNVIEAVVPRLADLRSVLENPPKQFYNEMHTTAGVLSPPLGNTRLQTIRLIYSILTMSTPKASTALYEHGFLQVILNLFFEYRWNTFLHKAVEDVVCIIISNGVEDCSSAGDSDVLTSNQQLLKQLLIDNEFIKKILDVWEKTEKCQDDAIRMRTGYMGQLTKMANFLAENLFQGKAESSFVQMITTELGDKIMADWNTSVQVTLTETNRRNKIDYQPLFGSGSSSDDDDVDYRLPVSLPVQALHQAFLDYQCQQQTSPFQDHFGYNEDEFAEQVDKVDNTYIDRFSNIDFSIATQEDTPNATMFEQACNEEIRQFDDSEEESDEEIDYLNNEVESGDPLRTSLNSSGGLNLAGSGNFPDDDDDVVVAPLGGPGGKKLPSQELLAQVFSRTKPSDGNMRLLEDLRKEEEGDRRDGSSDEDDVDLDDDDEEDIDLTSPRVVTQKKAGGVVPPLLVAAFPQFTVKSVRVEAEENMEVDGDELQDMAGTVRVDKKDESPPTSRVAWQQDNNNSNGKEGEGSEEASQSSDEASQGVAVAFKEWRRQPPETQVEKKEDNEENNCQGNTPRPPVVVPSAFPSGDENSHTEGDPDPVPPKTNGADTPEVQHEDLAIHLSSIDIDVGEEDEPQEAIARITLSTASSSSSEDEQEIIDRDVDVIPTTPHFRDLRMPRENQNLTRADDAETENIRPAPSLPPVTPSNTPVQSSDSSSGDDSLNSFNSSPSPIKFESGSEAPDVNDTDLNGPLNVKISVNATDQEASESSVPNGPV